MEPETKESVEKAREEVEQEESIHLQYMHERPRSQGLFDENGNADIKTVQNILKNHEGIVWRCIVSLREDDALQLDHMDRSKWEDSLKASFAEIQEKLGMQANNFRWTAAYHPEPGHPHCHVLFWEENPVKTKGTLSLGERVDMRKAFVKNICAPERSRLLLEKEYYRDAIRDGARDVLGLKNDLVQGSELLQDELGGKPSIAPRLFPAQRQQLVAKLERLAGFLPGHGRVALKYMPDETKAEVRSIADWLLLQPEFAQSTAQYMQANLEIVNMYMRDQVKEIDQAKERAYNDLRDRVAQDVLKAAVQMQNLTVNTQSYPGNKIGITKQQVISNCWKGAWKSIQKEKMKAEYQARIIQSELEREEQQKRKEGRSR